MAFEIIWSAEADNDFREIVIYLKKEWLEEVAEKFVARTIKKLERLSATPSIALPTSKNSVFIFKPDHKKVLFFTLEGTHLVLLSLYPYKKDIKKSNYY